MGRGGVGAALVAAPGFLAGEVRATRSIHRGLAPRIAANGARGNARVWWSAETEEKMVALTFDDGPYADLTPRVLDVLARHDAVATFFVIGQMVERDPDLFRAVHEAGHEIGSHTYHHRRAEEQSRDEVLDTVTRGADVLGELLGHRPRWFRPVKGHVTGAVLRAAARVGHDVAIWSLSRGPRTLADGDAAGVAAHLRAKVHPGAIALLHDGLGRTPLDRFGPDAQLRTRRQAELEALPEVLEAWAADGYRFVTLSELVDRYDGLAPEDGAPAPEELPVDDDLVDAVDASIDPDDLTDPEVVPAVDRD